MQTALYPAATIRFERLFHVKQFPEMYYIGCESGFQQKVVCVSSQKWLLFWIFMQSNRIKKKVLHNK